MKIAHIEKVEGLRDYQHVDHHRARGLEIAAPFHGMEKNAQRQDCKERGHHQHTPQQEGREQGRVGLPRLALHCARLARLEGQHQSQRDGKDEVDPKDLGSRHR